MSDIKSLEHKLNDAILNGKAMEAFEELYADDVVMQENTQPPTHGKDANRKREIEFFSNIEQFNGAAVLASAVEGDVSFSEWMMDVTFKGGQRYKLEQAVIRRWKNGKIASERFYYGK